MAMLFNLVWLVLGGFLMGLAWFLVGIVAAISIVGLPWAKACFTIGGFSLWPFGREAVNRASLTGFEDLGTGPLGLLGNLIWLVLFGWWLAVGHIAAAVACAVTIIGIPFAIQHLKLAVISLMPIGMEVVDQRMIYRGL